MAENRRTCASCGTPNEEDARFCEGCGGSLARVCATCGVEANATARFCRGCGAPLDGQVTKARNIPAAGPARKTVTVMFADLAGSTSFEERVDAETARDVIGHYHNLLRSIAERHRAGFTKYIGDGFMAVWGVPEIGPDDAAHAVDAAVALQERFVELATGVADTRGVELALRVAVNTGEVVVGAGDADLVGDALNVGARLEAECPRGHVVVGEETWRSTRSRYRYESLGDVQVKGRTAPVAVYQWLGRQSAAEAAPFVGRADEVRRLQVVFDDAVAARAARVVTVIGDPGVGKSRLAAEFTGARAGTQVIEARCDVEGTAALTPIVEMLRSRDLETDVPATVPERDRLLRDLNGLTTGVPGSVEENFWALRRFVEVLASNEPVLLILDDIQWADTLLLDFLEHLVEWVQEVPVLVLALARPELREIRPDLVTVSRWVSEAVHLDGLDAGATAELAAKVLGATQLPDELLRRLPSSTGGNPLFVRELIGMLAHDGVLVSEPAGWRLTIDADAIAIPPTIHALLASRLERLDATDRRVLEIASVVGSDFSLGTVSALADSDTAGVGLSLNRLRRLELAQPSGVYVGDEPVWRFHHVLIRDVAYRRLLKSDRADLHERLADWVVVGGPSVAFDSDETAARHLEAAHAYRVELGTHSGDLALRSARHYAAAARRALDRDELISAGTQAARGAALGADDEAVHAELLVIGCEAFLSAGDVAAGAALVDDLERVADEALAPWATCYRCQFVVYTAPERLLEVDARLQSAIDEFGRRADPAGLAKAHRVRASARARLGRIGDCEVDLFEALIAARQSQDHRQITAALGAAPAAALWGPSPVPKAGGRCLDVVRMQRMTTAAPSLEATSLRCLAVLELLRGRPDKARTMLAEARQIVADLGLRHGLMETELFAGIIELMEGDPVAAEPHFRTALEGLDALGVGADAGQAAALLARSVLAQGRVDEADRYAAESERLAGRNLKSAIAWRAVRAEILAAQGRNDDAAAMARDAVAVATETDLVLDHADACLTLSRVLAAAGDAKGANAARDDADRLYAAKEVAAAIGRTVKPASSLTPTPAEAGPTASRLAVTNQSCEIVPQFIGALRAHDIERAMACYGDQFEYDDRRRISGDPVFGREAMRAALARVLEQYTQFEFRVVAVRGTRLHLVWTRLADDDGNQTTTFYVDETDDDGRVGYHARFDEEDFESAYRELDRRYYAGEGAAFAEPGVATSEATIALDRNEFDRFFGEFCTPDLHVENRSRSAIPDRSATDLLASFTDLNTLVARSRTWMSVVRWLSPTWSVTRLEREAVGQDGEEYAWTRILVCELSDGRFTSVCEFDVEDEEAVFAYAEERMRATDGRFAVTNRASRTMRALTEAMLARDFDSAIGCYADPFVYDDRRRISGDPIRDNATMRRGLERIAAQYNDFDVRALAVRGERLHLASGRFSNDDGFETTNLFLHEVGDDGLITYETRFDGDDFDDAYRELERRYYAGEGAAFAEAWPVSADWVIALNQGDFDKVFGELSTSDMRIENRSRSAFPDRSAAEVRAGLDELNAMVASARTWNSVIRWLSPTCSVVRQEREAVGRDGERFAWVRLVVGEVRDGRIASSCVFDLEDEESAFAYAEEQVRATTSRLAVTNRATRAADVSLRAMQAHDAHGAVATLSDRFVYDDRRQLPGDPIEGADELLSAIARILEHYPNVEWRTLAVRGERLELRWTRWWDDDGNEATYLTVFEVGEDGLIEYHGRFDGDDFESAYRELDRRYYGGEGVAFAEAGAVTTDWIIALNHGDYDRLFGELTMPDMRVKSRSSSVFGDRTATEIRRTFEELDAMVSSARAWEAAVYWLSPAHVVLRFQREAVGRDGETFAWTWVDVCQIRNGRVVETCRFDLEDEEAAFAYAEEWARSTASRLPVTNRASENSRAFVAALDAHDLDGAMRCISEQFEYDDRRRLRGNPLDGARVGLARILDQYTNFEMRTLAVRGERLHLFWSRWSDEAGNETAQLHVQEVDDDGRGVYEGRFDEDDFEGAYRELERRFYACEGAAYAEAGAVGVEWVTALNRGDFDRVFNELTEPGMRVENRSLSVFGDPTAAELRATFEELNQMVASARAWSSAVCWLSPECGVARFEREAVGLDGEKYAWARLQAVEIRNGRLASLCRFEVDDEEAAFAYAEERVRATTSRLAVTNRACETSFALIRALQSGGVDDVMACFSDRFVYDDRRRLGGNPLGDLRTAMTRILAQYSHFEGRTLAVRGDRLHLLSSRWSDDAGNETTHLHVQEIDDGGRMTYEGRFDEDDLVGAYRVLEERYYADEGRAFAEAGAVSTDYAVAVNEGDFDRLFGELTAPDFRFENRSPSVFPDRTAEQLRATMEELNAMVASTRTWNPVQYFLSPTWSVIRQQREAVGLDGERFTWTGIYACECRDGRLASLCQFDVEDEEAAFAYAEEQMRATASRLAVTNLAGRTCDAGSRAMQARDLDAMAACYAASFVYDDRRRLGGNPIDDLGTAQRRILEQYNQFEYRTLAVRGERLHLGWSRWSNDAGYETTYLMVHQVDESGRFVYEGRFDDDNFEDAYRELERRYYAGEGSAFAEAGAAQTDWLVALNRGDLDRLFGELTAPEMHFEMRSSSAFPESSAAEARAAIEDFNATVASARTWLSAVSWISPTCCVNRTERQAVGHDNEQYAWTRLSVVEFRDGRMVSEREFDVDDEHAAFAYAEERANANTSRLAVTNRAKRTMDEIDRASQARDFDRAAAWYSPTLVYDDRRRLSGHPIGDMRTAIGRIAEQYTSYEFASLAVRGDRLHLGWTRWSNDSGFLSSSLWVQEVDDDGIVIYQARFDEDDFEDAYRELTQRYCADEGAAFAEIATLGAEWMIAMNGGDFDRAFNELTAREARVENRSSSAFPDRSATELRASLEDLNTMVTSVRSWNSVERWLSSTCGVVRHEREAVGQDGEQFAWTRVYVFEARDGRCVGWCEFELDDEAAAFAYAKERANVEP